MLRIPTELDKSVIFIMKKIRRKHNRPLLGVSSNSGLYIHPSLIALAEPKANYPWKLA